jgi:hypothetical protein
MDEKIVVFIVNDEQFGQIIAPTVEGVLAYLKSYLAELPDGCEIVFEIKRRDMTLDEIDKAAVV